MRLHQALSLVLLFAVGLSRLNAFIYTCGPAPRPPTALFAKSRTKKKSGPKPSLGFGSAKGASSLSKPVLVALKKVQRAPEQTEAWLALASELAQLGEYADARQVLEAGHRRCGEGDEGLLATALGAMRRVSGPEEVQKLSRDVEWPGKDDAEVWEFTEKRKKDIGFEKYSVPEPPRPCHRDTKHASGENLIFASKGPIIPPEECDWVVEQIEKAADAMWMRDANNVEAELGADAIYERPFPDRIWLRDVPGLEDWFRHRLQTRLFPMLQSLYPHIIAQPDDVRCHDTVVVRYDANGMDSLETHRDATSFSFTIALNRADDYEGGGTSFPLLKSGEDDQEVPFSRRAVKTDVGGVVVFPGQCFHGGNKITSGYRIIIPLFIFLDYNESRRSRGYILEELKDLGVIKEVKCVF